MQDRGAGIDLAKLPRATLERGFTTAGSLGHGFWLMLQTCDRLWLLTGPEGTTVVLEQDREMPGAAVAPAGSLNGRARPRCRGGRVALVECEPQGLSILVAADDQDVHLLYLTFERLSRTSE